MSSWTPFLIVGLTSGSVYALTALGLVLTYRTSGIFNFSYGAVAVAGPLVGLLFELMARGLDGVATTAKLVATIGLLLGIEALLVVIFGSQARPFPSLLPTWSFRAAGVHIGIDQIITVVIGAGSMLALYTYLRRTRTGIAMRAVVESADLVGLMGTSPRKVRSTAWIIGASFAAVSGLLLAPATGLDPLILTLLVVQAFSGAAVGAFSSLPLTYAGGLIVGIVYALSEKLASGPAAHLQWVQGLPGMPAMRWVGIVLAAAGAIAVPWMVGVKLPIYTNGLSLAIVFASLGLLVRTSGQISLAHFGFAAVGGAAMSHLAHGAHIPWLLALLLAGMCAIPVGVILAVPAIRLSGLYLALATFGFGILLANLVYPLKMMFGPYGSLDVPRPDLGPIHASSDKAFYFVVLIIAAVIIAFIVILERSRLGRLLRGLADSPIALTTRGTNINVTRVLVFGISAFIAAVGGATYASSVGFVSISTYPWFNSLVLLAVLFTVGRGTVRSPLLAGLAYVVVPSYLTSVRLVEGLPMLFGVSAILIAMQPFNTSGMRARLTRLAASWAPRSQRSPAIARIAALPPLVPSAGIRPAAVLTDAIGSQSKDELERTR